MLLCRGAGGMLLCRGAGGMLFFKGEFDFYYLNFPLPISPYNFFGGWGGEITSPQEMGYEVLNNC